MKYKIFVDGQEGTTGLEIGERLAGRDDIELLSIDPEKRKDPEARAELLNAADLAFLCLPDVAARESVSLVTNPETRVIDASTAHRTDPDWVYGLPELKAGQSELIANSKRVAVPGCHATGCVLALYPLVEAGILPRDYPVTCCSLSGYSGGGKKLIRKYQSPETAPTSPQPYALGLNHKHLPEIQAVVGLDYTPILLPVVSGYYRGMGVSVPLASRGLNGSPSAEDIHRLLSAHYASQRFVSVAPYDPDGKAEGGFFDVEGCNQTNRAEVFVFGGAERILVMVRLDNLGKGASGAAVQCMNIMLGIDPGTGLPG